VVFIFLLCTSEEVVFRTLVARVASSSVCNVTSCEFNLEILLDYGIIAVWRYDVMATLPIATNRLSYCPSRCGYTLFCLFVDVWPPLRSVMYIERSMRGGERSLRFFHPLTMLR
jgi:hypothetical protein